MFKINNLKSKLCFINLQFIFFIFISIFAYLINDAWIYNPYGWVDQWGYTGLAVYFPFLAQKFTSHPAVELMPVYLPHALLIKIIGFEGARIFKAIFLHSVCMYLVYQVSRTYSKNTFVSILTAILYGFYFYTLFAVGSDYTEVFVQLYLLLNLLCSAKLIENPNKYRYVFLAGVIYALLISTAILSIVYIFSLSILFLLINKYKIKIILYLFFGFIFGYTILFLILFKINSNFLLVNNILKLINFLGGVNQTPELGTWVFQASWLIFPSVIFISSIIFLIIKYFSRRELFSVYANNESNFFLVFSIILLSILIFINFYIKQWTLQFLYLGQVTPIFFISLSILLGSYRCYFKSLNTIFIIVTILSLNISLYYVNSHTLIFIDLISDRYGIFYISFLFLVFLSLCIYSTGFFRSAYTILLVSFFCFINTFISSSSYDCFICANARSFGNGAIASNKVNYLYSLEVSKFINTIDPARTMKIWFSQDSDVGPMLRQVFAMNYLNTSSNIINKNYPTLDNFSGPPGSEGTPPSKDSIILSIDMAENVCDKSLVSLHKYGIQIVKLEHLSFESPVKNLHFCKLYLN